MRKELKEQMKWNIDRTSPSNKLRALISWSVDIIKDVEYQETVLKNPLLKQLAAKWLVPFQIVKGGTKIRLQIQSNMYM